MANEPEESRTHETKSVAPAVAIIGGVLAVALPGPGYARDVNQNIGSVSQAAGETGSAAGQVLNVSQGMARRAEGLRGEVERFLGEVRAA